MKASGPAHVAAARLAVFVAAMSTQKKSQVCATRVLKHVVSNAHAHHLRTLLYQLFGTEDGGDMTDSRMS